METKLVEIEFKVSHNPNPYWRKLWDILLRPTETKPGVVTPTEMPSADNLPEKPIKKSEPKQLSLFPLDKTQPEREDIRPQIHKEV